MVAQVPDAVTDHSRYCHRQGVAVKALKAVNFYYGFINRSFYICGGL